MFKKTAAILALSAISTSASAGWVAGAGYSSLSLDGNATLGALVASAGYRFAINDAISVVPEARVGFGIKDDSGVELDNIYGIGVRGEYAMESGVYLFVAPTLTKSKISFKFDGSDVYDEFNFGNEDSGDGLDWFDMDDWDDPDGTYYQSFQDWLAAQGGNGSFVGAGTLPSAGSQGFAMSGSGSATSDWEFGFGIGGGFRINDFVAAELSYEMIDEADLLTLQARFSF